MKKPLGPSTLALAWSGLLPFFILGHFIHHLLPTLAVPLLPFMRHDFSLDYGRAGLIVSAFNLAYGVGQLLAGFLADRLSPRILITIGISGVALAGLGVGLSPSFGLTLCLLAAMGLLGGGYHPAAPPLISRIVGPENRGRGLGLHLIGGGASNFLTPLIATAIAAHYGWRNAFLFLSFPVMAYGILFYRKLKEVPPSREESLRKQENSCSSSPGNGSRLAAFIFLTTFTGAMTMSVIAYIPLYLTDQLKFGKETAGALYALIYFAGLIGSPLGGNLADRFGLIPMIVLSCLLAGPAIYFLSFVSVGWAILLVLTWIGVLIAIRIPVSESFIVAQTSAANRSSILGIYYFGGMEGSGVVTPLLGYLIDHFGFASAFAWVFWAMISVSAFCLLILWGKQRVPFP